MDLVNQFSLFERLLNLYKRKSSNKRMISACLNVTRDCRIKLLNILAFSINDDEFFTPIDPKVWVGSTKILVKGEGLAYE